MTRNKDGASHILIHDDTRAGRAVQQSLQVKVRGLIIRPLADMRRKGGECRRIVRFEFRERIQVAIRCRIVVLLARHRLESPECFRLAAQHKIADQSAAKLLDPGRELRADTNTSAELSWPIPVSRRR